MGFAIIIPNMLFDDVNLGKVTLQEDIPLNALNINGQSSIEGTSAEFTVKYTPNTTTHRSVIWEISEGDEYASINANTGMLTILQGANNSAITIKVKSKDYPLIYDTKSVIVTYKSSGVPTHTGSTYFIPLTTGSTPTEGTLNVTKEVATYSENGASFDVFGSGIAYALPSGTTIQAIAFDFKKLSAANLQNNNYLFDIRPSVSDNNGLNLYTSPNQNDLNVSLSSDTSIGGVESPFTMNDWHRVCVAKIGSYFKVFIDGEKYGNDIAWNADNNSIGNIVIGNTLRWVDGSRDRTFGGYVRNVALWTSNNSITENDMILFSELA